jgi:hypothetical protein
MQQLAKDDGFQDWAEMREWFRNEHGLPFDGLSINFKVIAHADRLQ